jgi:gamma-glutamyl hercynylcysteine S-oxide synthase
MHSMQVMPSSAIDSPSVFQAGRDVLSLALMDARNHTLYLLAQFEALQPELQSTQAMGALQLKQLNPPLWLLGYVGWFQEWWIGRNTQRALGAQCPALPTRLASIEPRADLCWNPLLIQRADRWTHTYPDPGSIKAYLLETLETTLELLEKTDDRDTALYFYRMALAREDQIGEQLAVLAQALDLKINLPPSPVYQHRAPLCVPATQWTLGAAREGFTWDNEAGAHTVAVPEFEIDAQPISWAQYVEFTADGGYDDAQHWLPQGWDWLQTAALAEGRRGPRYVEQIGVTSGAVLTRRFGQDRRAAGSASAMHVTWHEAQAYASWAGRRLATEVEWDIAAHKAQGMGYRWGDVWEWTANTFRPYPGFVAGPWVDYSARSWDHSKVLRGASFSTRARMKQPSFRGFARADTDVGFFGFRTCAV